jgi:hypothetical protein
VMSSRAALPVSSLRAGASASAELTTALLSSQAPDPPPGEGHGQLSAAYAERDNLRALTSVIDTAVQRAESAFGVNVNRGVLFVCYVRRSPQGCVHYGVRGAERLVIM